MSASQEKIEAALDAVEQEITALDPTLVESSIEKCEHMIFNIRIKPRLQATADQLKKSAYKAFKHKIKITIGTIFTRSTKTRKVKKEETRLEKLRTLNCDALKFLGLTFSVQELLQFGDKEFGYLLTALPQYAHVFELLYNEEIDDFIDKAAEVYNDQQYELFREAHLSKAIELRNQKTQEMEMSLKKKQSGQTLPKRPLDGNIDAHGHGTVPGGSALSGSESEHNKRLRTHAEMEPGDQEEAMISEQDISRLDLVGTLKETSAACRTDMSLTNVPAGGESQSDHAAPSPVDSDGQPSTSAIPATPSVYQGGPKCSPFHSAHEASLNPTPNNSG